MKMIKIIQIAMLGLISELSASTTIMDVPLASYVDVVVVTCACMKINMRAYCTGVIQGHLTEDVDILQRSITQEWLQRNNIDANSPIPGLVPVYVSINQGPYNPINLRRSAQHELMVLMLHNNMTFRISMIPSSDLKTMVMNTCVIPCPAWLMVRHAFANLFTKSSSPSEIDVCLA
jgi:hypothetical protein